MKESVEQDKCCKNKEMSTFKEKAAVGKEWCDLLKFRIL